MRITPTLPAQIVGLTVPMRHDRALALRTHANRALVVQVHMAGRTETPKILGAVVLRIAILVMNL